MAPTIKRIKADSGEPSRRRRIAIIGLVLFLIVDIVLVVWALTSVRTPRHDSGSAAVVPSSVKPVDNPEAAPSTVPSPTATTATAGDAVAPTRVIAALDATTAWRASTGPCPATPAAPELTTDGGANWKATNPSGATGASSIIRLTVQSGRQASAVALSAKGCAPEFIRTYVSGDNWASYPDQLTSTWYADPSKQGSLHAPTGDVTAPCPSVVGLAVRDSAHAAVLCANHDVYRTTNGGSAWGSPQRVPGAVALTVSDSGYLVGAADSAGCAGVQSLGLDATSGAATAKGCAGSNSPAPGTVALSGGSGVTWLWAGDSILKSSDGGATWH